MPAEFDASFGLRDALQQMGMGSAFGSDADFSGIDGARDLYISDVVHKAFVAVDEAGTEAAAATAVLMERMNAVVGQPVQFTADRPFIFLIRDNASGTVLFLGRVLNPGG